jgi:hypothetical protein
MSGYSGCVRSTICHSDNLKTCILDLRLAVGFEPTGSGKAKLVNATGSSLRRLSRFDQRDDKILPLPVVRGLDRFWRFHPDAWLDWIE